jgi:hypothetical protein
VAWDMQAFALETSGWPALSLEVAVSAPRSPNAPKIRRLKSLVSSSKLSRLFLAGPLLVAVSCSEAPTAPEPNFKPGVAAREVSVDFSSFGGIGVIFEHDFYRSDGILFPPEQCGPAGCDPWTIDLIQGDAALLAENQFGPVRARFTRPVSSLSVRVAPALQGTARYVLKAFAASGKLLARTSVTVTQDSGDPADTGFGYFTISLSNLPGPAKSFTLDNVFLRSTFPTNDNIPYGVSSISYRHWGGKP